MALKRPCGAVGQLTPTLMGSRVSYSSIHINQIFITATKHSLSERLGCVDWSEVVN